MGGWSLRGGEVIGGGGGGTRRKRGRNGVYFWYVALH